MKQTRFPLAIALALVIVGCGPSPGDSTGAAGRPAADAAKQVKGTIGVSVLTLQNPFFKVIGDKLTEEAAKFGYDTIVVDGNEDVATQQSQVRDFINRKVAAIVLCPCDSKAIGPVIQEANRAGIPVFTTDLASMAPGAKVVSHIATDNLGGGREAGRAMIEALGETGGKVAILHFKQAESCLLRVQGFREVIDEHNGTAPGRIAIVAELPGGGKKDQGYRAAADAIQAHPDLRGIFAINDPSALGAWAAIESAGKSDQVKIIGFDGQPEGKQAIKDGKIYADPIQFPDKMGIETARTIMKHFEGEEVPAERLIPTSLYRKADADRDPGLR
jgi:ribose transport system substrate-binding protein